MKTFICCNREPTKVTVKSNITTLFIALVVGFLGGASSRFFLEESTPVENSRNKNGTASLNTPRSRVDPVELKRQVERVQEKISRLESRLNEFVTKPATVAERADRQMQVTSEKADRQRMPVIPDRELLVSAGVSPEAAGDILRRISRQEFRMLELKNLMQRGAPADRQQYAAELRELRQNKVTLRSELGDDAYDRYLFASGQANRVKVSSVMAGSPAEINGIHKGDVILYYGDRKILATSDLSKATLEGDIGSYINVEVLRDGARMSLLLPRGTLGVQLEAVRLDPDR